MAKLEFTNEGYFVIDISAYQKGFDVARAVREHGLKGVILKIGGGDGYAPFYKDSAFDDLYAQCERTGTPKGCYFFGAATTTTRAKQEADYWLGLMKGKRFDLPVFYDVETKAQCDLNKTALTNIIKTVLERVEAAGYFVGVYSAKSWYQAEFDKSIPERYAAWVAAWPYNVTPQNPDTLSDKLGKYKPKLSAGDVQVWQTGIVRLNGINVDGDLCYVGNYPEVIKSLGLNGFGTSKTEVPDADDTQEAHDPKKSNQEIANEIWLGKWGNGDTRKKLITAAGYDYNEIQKIVNCMDGPLKTNEEIAREVWQGKWGNGSDRRKRVEEAGYDYEAIQAIVDDMA